MKQTGKLRILLSACLVLLLLTACFAVQTMGEEEGDWEYSISDNQVTITAYHGSEKIFPVR